MLKIVGIAELYSSFLPLCLRIKAYYKFSFETQKVGEADAFVNGTDH